MSALQLVFKQEANEVLMTDSRRLADGFGMRHDNLLAKMKGILADTEESFTLLNFKECFRINELANGKPEPIYEMTRDGFMFIARTFTGKKGNAFAIKVIELFNRMESELAEALPKLSSVSPSMLRQIADTLEKKDALIAEQTTLMTQSPLDLAFEHAKPISAFMTEFPELRAKAQQLYHEAVKTRTSNGYKPSSLLTMWIRKEFDFITLKKNVYGGKGITVVQYNRADVLQVVEKLRSENES